MSSRRVLVVDDDAGVRASLRAALIEADFEVDLAADGREALSRFGSFRPGIVLSDVRMPDLDGVALLEWIREYSPATGAILMTAYQDMPTVVRAMRLGAVEFLVKPLDLHLLLAVLTRAFEDRALRASKRAAAISPPASGDLIGEHTSMLSVYKLIGQAAASSTTVLVRGESGTGKELVARAIHRHSDLAEKAFVAVNCAAIPPTLLESELFGHVRGAFTGAVASREGRFAQARHGTIFLDEIGDTTPEFQSKLLRVLQQREFFPVGSDRAERADARVIAATHRNLEAMLADGRFREDLYYRLRVIEIVLPPLRARTSDIAVLARHLLARVHGANGAAIVLSDEALELLQTHEWPGNVRELEHALTRAALVAPGNVVRPEHVRSAISAVSQSANTAADEIPSLEQVEREHLERVLALTDGNRTRAAELLRVTAPRLRRLIRRFGLD